jgi:O-antigen/teichoic acid export membrane protein
MKNNSLVKSSIYSGIKSLLSITFPLITIKYASVVLGADNLGSVEFARSLVSYFVLIAGLGIEGFATRNGSALKSSQKKITNFSNSVFSLNFLSGILAFALLMITLSLVTELKNYTLLIFLFSIQIPLSVIGVEWIYFIYEDFKYITIRTIITQLVSIMVLFLFVKNESDVLIYALVLIIATYGANIFNFYNSKKYVRLKLRVNKNSLVYLPAAFVLFFNKIATTIYVNSDITMLGFLSSTSEIGIYSTAVKIYTAVKMLVTAILNVALPRLTFNIRNNRADEYDRLVILVIKALILLIPPSMIGIILQSKNLILLVSNQAFVSAVPALVILSVALIFSAVAMFCSATVLMPMNKEKIILKSTVVGAVINIVLNVIMLPIWGFVGAAITTLLSELFVSTVQLSGAWKTLKSLNLNVWKNIFSSFVGCMTIVFINLLVKGLTLTYLIELFIAIALSIAAYFIIQILMKNDLVLLLLRRIKIRIVRR